MIRLWNSEVLKETSAVGETIWCAFLALFPTPHPSPARGEEFESELND